MSIRERIGKERLYFDGGSGTMLQAMGLAPGELPETWNLTHPKEVRRLHAMYFEAGSDIVLTNTFGLNGLKYDNVEEIAEAAVSHVRAAAEPFEKAGRTCYCAFDIGPCGHLLKPLGDLDFEDAVALFARNVKAAVKAGADLIVVETMNDLYEAKAAVLAAKENSDLPVFLTTVYDASCHLMTGATPETVVAMAEGLGVDAIGANCSLGPQEMLDHVVPRLLACAHVPLIIKPNAGLPRVTGGKTVYDVDEETFAGIMEKIAKLGVPTLGGCCGTTPDYLRLVKERTCSLPVTQQKAEERTVITSYTNALDLVSGPVLIGGRIDPSVNEELKEALDDGDTSLIEDEAFDQQDEEVQALKVCTASVQGDEAALLAQAVSEIQSVMDLPLQISASEPEAMERALRVYNGHPLAGPVRADEQTLNAAFPLIRKYGGVLIVRTADVQTARSVVSKAAAFGIRPADLLFEPETDPVCEAALACIAALHENGYGTCLDMTGDLSRQPDADWFLDALERGLNCVILDPLSGDLADAAREACDRI